MRIKKFVGEDEQKLMGQIKAELGQDALILNIKKVQPRGVFAFFRKPLVEISAAFEDKPDIEPLRTVVNAPAQHETRLLQVIAQKSGAVNQKERSLAQENHWGGRQNEQFAKNACLFKDYTELKKNDAEREEKKANSVLAPRHFKSELVRHFYNSLLEHDVMPEIADEMFKEFKDIDDNDNIDINLIVKIVYNTIVKILGEPDVIDISGASVGQPTVVALMGSTGVGKTTTIAKLTAEFMFKKNAKVSLLTADTYRVAAVEQLKTYADILGIDIGVVYSAADMKIYADLFKKDCELLIVDTAGRSHRNTENMSELQEILTVLQGCKKYLTISLTTKSEDIFSIIDSYNDMGDFSILYTKLDETMKYGAILNVSYVTGRKISYITNGQNVPDDLMVLTPEVVAKALLGLGDNT